MTHTTTSTTEFLELLERAVAELKADEDAVCAVLTVNNSSVVLRKLADDGASLLHAAGRGFDLARAYGVDENGARLCVYDARLCDRGHANAPVDVVLCREHAGYVVLEPAAARRLAERYRDAVRQARRERFEASIELF